MPADEQEEKELIVEHVRNLVDLCGELAEKQAVRDNSYLHDPRFLSALLLLASQAKEPEPGTDLRPWVCPECGEEGEGDPQQVPLYCWKCYSKPGAGKWIEVVWSEAGS